MTKIEIQHIAFGEDKGVEISYYLPESDVKAPGVARMATLIVPRGFEYDDEIDAAYDAIKHLVLDVLEDFDAMPAMPDSADTP